MKKRLEELIKFAESTDLQEVVWEKKGSHISFRRSALSASPAQTGTSRAERPVISENGLSDPSLEADPGPMIIKSTMVGTFYRSDSPARPPMVVEGTVVVPGQPVGAIEAMKIMKDVLATSSCKIVRALVANGHPVEYGQPLFEVEPQPEAPPDGGAS